jgi:tRNA(Arg) A34 adenosine deaminase TadA
MIAMARAKLAEAPSTQDYFRLLAKRAQYAAEQGNYAISAALVLRERSVEAIFEGWNTLFGQRDPSGHAEMNAIRLSYAVSRLPDDTAASLVKQAQGANALHTREHDGPHEPERVLYTTLEPCPMCTVCLINAGIRHVVVAAQDPPSGALEHSRLRQLPPLWSHLADVGGLRVSFCQTRDPDDPITYLPPPLHNELIDRFTRSRTELDEALGTEGVLDTAAASLHAWKVMHGG